MSVIFYEYESETLYATFIIRYMCIMFYEKIVNISQFSYDLYCVYIVILASTVRSEFHQIKKLQKTVGVGLNLQKSPEPNFDEHRSSNGYDYEGRPKRGTIFNSGP